MKIPKTITNIVISVLFALALMTIVSIAQTNFADETGIDSLNGDFTNITADNGTIIDATITNFHGGILDGNKLNYSDLQNSGSACTESSGIQAVQIDESSGTRTCIELDATDIKNGTYPVGTRTFQGNILVTNYNISFGENSNYKLYSDNGGMHIPGYSGKRIYIGDSNSNVLEIRDYVGNNLMRTVTSTAHDFEDRDVWNIKTLNTTELNVDGAPIPNTTARSISISSNDLYAVSGSPSQTVTNSKMSWRLDAASSERLGVNIAVPDDHVPNTDVNFTLYWSAASAQGGNSNRVRWEPAYYVVNDGTALTTMTGASIIEPIYTETAAWEAMSDEMGFNVDPTGYDWIVIDAGRRGADAQDNLTGDMAIYAWEMHYTGYR
jgi:hypothetical protein